MPRRPLEDIFGVSGPMSTPEDKTWGDSLRQATPNINIPGMPISTKDTAQITGNIPRSAYNAVAGTLGGLWTARNNVVNNPGILKSIKDVGLGESTKNAGRALYDTAVQPYINRYGSLDKARQTILNDPVGVAADVGYATGGYGLARKAGLGLEKAVEPHVPYITLEGRGPDLSAVKMSPYEWNDRAGALYDFYKSGRMNREQYTNSLNTLASMKANYK